MGNFRLMSAAALVLFGCGSANCQVIFETDWANDAGFDVTAVQGSWEAVTNVANRPEGFSGTLIEGNGRIYAVEGAGYGGGRAMKFEWDPDLGQPVTQLYKHLTDNPETGYDDIYVRYRLKLPGNFKMGNPAIDDIPYWKFGRLWQNTGLDPRFGSAWSENRVDSFYAVWNFGGTSFYGVDAAGVFGANSGADLKQGSAGGERYSNGYYTTSSGAEADKPGNFRHVGNTANAPAGQGWDFSHTTRLLEDTSQKWHTIEWRFKLSSSPTAFDGTFEMWFDGDKQVPVKLGKSSAAPALPPGTPVSCNPTAKNGGSGYNMLVVFDNMTFINGVWDEPDVEGGIYVSDIVVSTQRIGSEYIVGGAPAARPNPPTAFSTQ